MENSQIDLIMDVVVENGSTQPISNVVDQDVSLICSKVVDNELKNISKNKVVPLLSIQTDEIVRGTKRMTELYDLEIQMRQKKGPVRAICCCINPFIDEEATIYFPGFDYVTRDDIFLHSSKVRTQHILCNLCWYTDTITRKIYQRANDGLILPDHKVSSLNLDNNADYVLDTNDSCTHKHHHLKRYSNFGRILNFACTISGIFSTVQKCVCPGSYWDEIDVQTVSCERKLYRKKVVR